MELLLLLSATMKIMDRTAPLLVNTDLSKHHMEHHIALFVYMTTYNYVYVTV